MKEGEAQEELVEWKAHVGESGALKPGPLSPGVMAFVIAPGGIGQCALRDDDEPELPRPRQSVDPRLTIEQGQALFDDGEAERSCPVERDVEIVVVAAVADGPNGAGSQGVVQRGGDVVAAQHVRRARVEQEDIEAIATEAAARVVDGAAHGGSRPIVAAVLHCVAALRDNGERELGPRAQTGPEDVLGGAIAAGHVDAGEVVVGGGIKELDRAVDVEVAQGAATEADASAVSGRNQPMIKRRHARANQVIHFNPQESVARTRPGSLSQKPGSVENPLLRLARVFSRATGVGLGGPMTRKRLGQIIIEVGLITQEQLENALVGQQVHGTHLGEELVRSGLLREETLVQGSRSRPALPPSTSRPSPCRMSCAAADLEFESGHSVRPLIAAPSALDKAIAAGRAR